MRVAFAGSTDFSIPSLEALHEQRLVHVVLTSPDKPAGRGLHTQTSPVKQFAQAHNIPVLQPEHLRLEVITKLANFDLDVLVCVAYGKIFGPKFLSLFKRGSVNVHPSLLPRFRGAAPIPATILAGDDTTGVTLQKIAQRMDCGDIIMQSEYHISPQDNSSTLLKTLSQQGRDLLLQLFANFDSLYNAAQTQQEEKAVYCQKITPNMGNINWTESAKQIELLIRAYAPPYNGVKVFYKNNILKLWQAKALTDKPPRDLASVGCVVNTRDDGIVIQCRRGTLLITELQLAGKKRMPWDVFLRGEPNFIGSALH